MLLCMYHLLHQLSFQYLIHHIILWQLIALPTRSSSSMSNLKDDLESDNTFQFIDDRMKSRLYNSYSTLYPSSDHDAQKLRSQLPLELNLSSLGVLSKEKVKRKLPPMQEVEEDEVSEEYYAQALPRSINQITSQKLDEDHRPIVITSTKNPFRIVAVNTAWENLCKRISYGGTYHWVCIYLA